MTITLIIVQVLVFDPWAAKPPATKHRAASWIPSRAVSRGPP